MSTTHTTAKKNFVVTYFRNADYKKAAKTGNEIPLYTTEVIAASIEDATAKTQKRSLVIYTVAPRGRGGLKKNVGTLSYEAARAHQFGPSDEEALFASVISPVEQTAEIVAVDTEAQGLDTRETEAPLEIRLNEATPDTFHVTQSPENEPSAIADPVEEPTEPQAVFTHYETEQAKQYAITQIDELIEKKGYAIDDHWEAIDALDERCASARERVAVIDNEMLHLDNALSLRPLAIEALREELGFVPVAIPTEPSELEWDMTIAATSMNIENALDETRHEARDQYLNAIDTLDDEIAGLKYLRSELTGEPIDEAGVIAADEDEGADETPIFDSVAHTDEDGTTRQVETFGLVAGSLLFGAGAVAAHTPHLRFIFALGLALTATFLGSLLQSKEQG